MTTGLAYAGRFGSLSRALEQVRREPPGGFPLVELRARIKRALHDEFDAILSASDMPPKRHKSVSFVLGRPPILVEGAMCESKERAIALARPLPCRQPAQGPFLCSPAHGSMQ
jgi:hypothetical protein